MGRVRFRGWNIVKIEFSYRNVLGSTKYVDPAIQQKTRQKSG